jgi:hypothetical protein
MELIGKSVCFVVCDIGTEIYNTAISWLWSVYLKET